jgi:hypothetical protein
LLLDKQARTLEVIARHVEALYAAQGNLSYAVRNIGLFENDGSLKSRLDNAFSINQSNLGLMLDFAQRIKRDPSLDPPNAPSIASVALTPAPDSIVPPAVVVTLFEHDNYLGGRVDLTASTPNLNTYGFNDTVSSFKVAGAPGEYTVEFFEGYDFYNPFLKVQSPFDCPQIPVTRWMDLPVGGFGRGVGFRRTPIRYNDALSSVRITKNY